MIPVAQQGLLPTGNVLCPQDGCRGFDPANLGAGLDGLAGVVVTIATLATYLIATLAVLWIIYAAFLFLLGGEKGGERGRKVILNAFIAILIAVLAYPAVQILINILDQFKIG